MLVLLPEITPGKLKGERGKSRQREEVNQRRRQRLQTKESLVVVVELLFLLVVVVVLLRLIWQSTLVRQIYRYRYKY